MKGIVKLEHDDKNKINPKYKTPAKGEGLRD
jgi:hypothetical protein